MGRSRVKQKRSFNGHVGGLPNKRLCPIGFSLPLIMDLDGLAVVSQRVNRSVRRLPRLLHVNFDPRRKLR
jgi:hypothetical protein